MEQIITYNTPLTIIFLFSNRGEHLSDNVGIWNSYQHCVKRVPRHKYVDIDKNEYHPFSVILNSATVAQPCRLIKLSVHIELCIPASRCIIKEINSI